MTEKLSILAVEDDLLEQKVIAAQLREHQIDFAVDVPAARRKLETGRYDFCFIDLQLGKDDDGYSGLSLIPIAISRKIYSVVMSGHDSEECVEKAYALGCNDFYAKGDEQSSVAQVVARFLERHGENRNDRVFTDIFVTQDPATKTAILEALSYAPSPLPVLILGPSGTGKTSLARLIHDHSNRTGQFVAINCSAYSEELLEAELFGFRKGAFTGANDNRQGKLLAADRGTLFLDEIGAMSLKMQTKLLKAIEEQSFYPLGSDKPEISRFRIISATLEDLQSLIKAGKLRFDFFQRIHGLNVRLKPLASRSCDIFPLISFFTRGSRRLSFTAEAKQRLLSHDWPGNIRELKRLVDLLAAGQEGRVDLEAVDHLLQTLRIEEKAGDFITEEQYRFAERYGLNEAVDRFVNKMIERSLADNGGKKTGVLTHLKIPTSILYTSLNRQGIPVRENRSGTSEKKSPEKENGHREPAVQRS